MTNFISQAEADELCEAMLRQYLGRDAPVPDRIDVDGFVRDYLKCTVLYETFAEDDPDKIGFAGDGRTPLKIRRDGKTVSEVFPFKTIVLERYLLRPEETAHRRFTLGHEAGHIIAMRISPDSVACFHHSYDGQREYTAAELRERYTIGEWQANTISASLLMPVPIMKKALRKFNGGRRLPVYGETVFHPREKVILQKMASSLGVSFTALVIRLRGLGLLSRHSIGEYIGSELRFGGDTS